MLSTSQALVRFGTINELRDIGRMGIVAVYKKYDYQNNYRRRSEVDEEGKRCAKLFINTLKGVQKLENERVPDSRKFKHAIGVYCGMNGYIKDVKSEALEKLSKAAKVIKRNSKPEEVKEAIENLRWYEELVEERTREDYQTYGAIVSRTHISIS